MKQGAAHLKYLDTSRLKSVSEYYQINGPNATQQFLQSYTYDRYGNRTINQGSTWGNGINSMQAAVVPNTTTNRLYAPGETEQNHPLINYDDAGNQTKDYYSVASVNYDRVYDAENRMTATTSSGNHASSYTFNADGQRVRRKTNGTGRGRFMEWMASYWPSMGRTVLHRVRRKSMAIATDSCW